MSKLDDVVERQRRNRRLLGIVLLVLAVIAGLVKASSSTWIHH